MSELGPEPRQVVPPSYPLTSTTLCCLLEGNLKVFLCSCWSRAGVFEGARAQGVPGRVGRTYKNFYLWSCFLMVLCFLTPISFCPSWVSAVDGSLKAGLPEPARVVCSISFLLRTCTSFYDRELLTKVCGAHVRSVPLQEGQPTLV